MNKKYLLFWGCLIFSTTTLAQPILYSATPVDTLVEQYARFELELDLSASYTNPHDFDQVTVQVDFTGPGGQTLTVDGFFKESYLLNTNGSLSPDGEGFFVRFAPAIVGNWSYVVRLQDGTGTVSLPVQSFQCLAKTDPLNQGYVRTGQSNYLEFDDGEQYIPVGENICWENNNPYLDYKKWLDKLSDNGGNFFRLWHAHWGLGIEWKNNWDGFSGLRRYHEVNSRYQDWLYDYAAEKGIYVMLALQHHGPVSTQVNPNWEDSPYNVANGGPCQNTWDFFTDSTARAHTRNRYRYIMARWGYARSIMSWELFNEVGWTDNFQQHKMAVGDWHAEMAAYLKSIDPYQHLVTTSYAREENDPLVWTNPDFDFTQTHFYVNTAHIERVLSGGVRRYLDAFDKPTLNGEFGIGASSTLPGLDPDGIHIHNGLWGGLFGGGLGTAMSWWWDIYIHPQDLYHHFDPVTQVATQIPFKTARMTPTPVLVSGAPGDLTLTPTGDWGLIGEDSITISPEGVLSPANPQLGNFLYGAQWNTQFRSPPVFVVTYPMNGTFTVHTSSGTGTSPTIVIQVDGQQVLSQSAGTNQDYTVPISPGTHTIRVDNSGTDWISISAYRFSGLGSLVDAYVLKGQANRIAAGWVLNTGYNHQTVPTGGVPSPVSGAVVHLTGMADTSYFVKWYDCLTGSLVASDPVLAQNGTLDLSVPALLWDLAFRVDPEKVPFTALEKERALPFVVYPNPVRAGAALSLEVGNGQEPRIELSLIDASGRILQQEILPYAPGTQWTVPASLATGIYWLKLERDGQAGTKAIVVE